MNNKRSNSQQKNNQRAMESGDSSTQVDSKAKRSSEESKESKESDNSNSNSKEKHKNSGSEEEEEKVPPQHSSKDFSEYLFA